MPEIVEKRRHKRNKTLNQGVVFVWFVVQNDMASAKEVKGGVTDISISGLGLHTQETLEPGQYIKFINKENKHDFPEVGVVMWTAESKDGYKAGVKFE